MKELISERKKELKGIGDKVDKDLNKSLFKVKGEGGSASNAINLRDIFSAPPKSNNHTINLYQ